MSSTQPSAPASELSNQGFWSTPAHDRAATFTTLRWTAPVKRMPVRVTPR